MAGASPFVLPQFQGSLYDLQRQQALANALMERSLTPQQPAPGAAVGPYQVQARMSALAPISQLGQALLSAKMGGQAAQGLNDLGQQQWGALTNMLGGGAGMQSPQLNPGSADAGGTGADAVTGNAGGNGSAAANAGGAALSGNTAGPVGSNGGVGSSPLNPLGMNPGMAAMMMMQSPDKYWETQAAAYKPADIVQQIRAAGIDPASPLGRQISQNMLAKQTAPDYASFRPGGYALNKTTGQMEQLPNVPEGFTAQRSANGQWRIVPVQGSLQAMSDSAAAKAGGAAQYQLQEVWDPAANGGQGGYVRQTVANVANAANGGGMRGVPSNGIAGIFAQQESNGGKTAPDNPFQIQQGTFNQYAQKGESWNNVSDRNMVAQRVLNTYNDRYGGDLGRIATAYFSGEGNVAPPGSPTPFLRNVSDRNGKSVASYVGDILGRAGGGMPQSGPMASQPPLGATSNANASQQASADTMKTDYEALQAARQNAPVVLQAYDHLIDLAKRAPSIANGGIGGMAASSQYAPYFSADAAEYDKTRAFLISTLGKDLGKNNSDAARATISQMIPEYGKPLQAKLDGLQQARDQVAMKSLRGSFLTPAFKAGDSKQYTDLANQFDNNVKPGMLPVLQMSGDAQRSAVQAAIKANPSLRSNFEWAFNNGLLK